MDGQGFDRIARMLASGMSRRDAVRALAAGVGATALTAMGLTSALSDVVAAGKLKLSKSPAVKFDGFTAVITLQISESAFVVVEYGKTKKFGSKVATNKSSRSHKVALSDLSPKTRYYYRVQMQTKTTTETSKTYTVTTPSCPRSTVLCGESCVPKCGVHATLDKATCSCTCTAGYGDCDGDPGNGCETRLNTVENCLGCGITCDDGNACTVNTCDRHDGCQTAAVADGTPCGTNGICANGVCGSCVASGTCQADTDCCDDEFCCQGVCVARATFLDDVDNCGSCGNVCVAGGTCQAATCIDGSCQSVPAAEHDPCDDGNPCTEDDHCMSGACMGNPVTNGSPCGEGGTCSEGMCVVCTTGNTCSGDGDCCADEACCDGTCIGVVSFESDPANCGGCGHICEGEDICHQVVCDAGICGKRPIDDGTACDDDNPCVERAACVGGVCKGDAVEDGTTCGDAGTCEHGECVESGAVLSGLIFSDDFESGGMSRWTSVQGIAAQKNVITGGTWAARMLSTGAPSYASKTLDFSQSDLFVRTRFQIVSQGSNSVFLLRTITPSGSPQVSALITSTGRLATFNALTGTTTTSATTIAKSKWYELQIHVTIAGTSSLIEVWLDGTKVADLSKTLDLRTTAIGQIQIGDDLANRTFDIVFDDVAVCAGELCPAASAPPAQTGTSTVAGATSGVLLSTYTHNTHGMVDWSKILYRPRQFAAGLSYNDPTWGSSTVEDAGIYGEWDVFYTYNWSVQRIETRADWTQLELNRPATLAILWRGGSTIPNWLSAWTKSGNVVISGKTFPTFRKGFSSGLVTLGAVYDPTDTPGKVTRDTYWVLLAEADGLRSPSPVTPAGQIAPTPNGTCPQWVHDRYLATGPDGQSYPTWHQQIDATYWCYHRHEHGTNPSWFSGDKKSLFGYTAAKHGMSEPHAGFKNYVFDSQDGTRWMITHHFGTAGIARACSRFHTVDIAVKNIASGELLADLHFMGDFGKSIVNTTSAIMSPVACPDQAALTGDSRGFRMLPTFADGASGYEPWQVDTRKLILGITSYFNINTKDGIVVCNDAQCSQAVATGGTGTMRFFSPNGTGITAGANSGVFYTDPQGKELRGSSASDAVRQYVKPGATMSVTLPTKHCFDVYGWGKKFACDAPDASPTNREGSITAPN